MGWAPPTEQEFKDEYITVADYERINRAVLEYQRHKSLMAKLVSGLVVGVARTGATGEYVLVTPSLWRTWKEAGDSHFWGTGEARFGEDWYFDVRFWIPSFDGKKNVPAEFMRDPPRVGDGLSPAHQKAPRRQDLPLLPNQIGEAWAAWFKSTAPKVTQGAAEVSAAQMFPNHNFSRDRIRDLIEPAKQGQRPNNR